MEPVKNFAKTVRKHWFGILRYFKLRYIWTNVRYH
ncbi:MAG: hypothetical protein LBU04_05450 [Christensenellaceae bacterium]|nr:hypothetical protein [Christensenellaceae bacterium]